METIKNLFNDNLKEIDFYLHVSMKTLDKLGWSFDDIIDYEVANIEAKNEEIRWGNEMLMNENSNQIPYPLLDENYDSIKDQVFNDCVVTIHVSGTPDKFITTDEINRVKDFYSFISNGCAESTGDDEKTIYDIVEILKDNDFSIDNYHNHYGSQRSYPSVDDYSVDNDNCYISAFKDIVTMKS